MARFVRLPLAPLRGARIVVLAILAVWLGQGAAARAPCDPATLWITGDFGTARFSVDVVDTPQTRARGLMFVEEMPRARGMLFVYERPQPVSFWMKNTLIPLDMIFADASGIVQRIHAQAVPGDLTAIPGGTGIQYVLEINGGLADMLGLAAGDRLWHPAIAPETPTGACAAF